MLTEEVAKSPDDTIRDVTPYMDEAGVTRVADITGMDRIGIPVYAAIRPDSKSLAVDSGKGTTKAQAKCSAIMEGIERWAQDAFMLKCEYAPLRGGCAFHFPMVRGACFSIEYPHKWLEAKYWNDGKAVLVPYYHVRNYEARIRLHEMCWQSGTNGLAAGNTRDEAILHGIYEIIERDAVTIWMAKGAATGEYHRIDNDTINDDTINDLIGMCSIAGVEVFIYNATSDIGIPTYVCIMLDRKAAIGVYKGYGCNLDSTAAVQRSICEAAQGRAVFLSGGRDDMRWQKYVFEMQAVSNSKRFHEMVLENKQPYFLSVIRPQSDSEQTAFLDNRLAEKGLGRVIVADFMTRQHASVVKVMAEGLEGYWNPYLQIGKRAE